ncbi:hypothetical protein VTN49DRAFT_767 [Thermomyces lanuginosus]|uniref:uncharacterized protein n=1 Tax=Thermomyces lanuginosus TaxID=5541 RepID=UPI0037447827
MGSATRSTTYGERPWVEPCTKSRVLPEACVARRLQNSEQAGLGVPCSDKTLVLRWCLLLLLVPLFQLLSKSGLFR